jgi:hypothetical protein
MVRHDVHVVANDSSFAFNHNAHKFLKYMLRFTCKSEKTSLVAYFLYNNLKELVPDSTHKI